MDVDGLVYSARGPVRTQISSSSSSWTTPQASRFFNGRTEARGGDDFCLFWKQHVHHENRCQRQALQGTRSSRSFSKRAKLRAGGAQRYYATGCGHELNNESRRVASLLTSPKEAARPSSVTAKPGQRDDGMIYEDWDQACPAAIAGLAAGSATACYKAGRDPEGTIQRYGNDWPADEPHFQDSKGMKHVPRCIRRKSTGPPSSKVRGWAELACPHMFEARSVPRRARLEEAKAAQGILPGAKEEAEEVPRTDTPSEAIFVSSPWGWMEAGQWMLEERVNQQPRLHRNPGQYRPRANVRPF